MFPTPYALEKNVFMMIKRLVCGGFVSLEQINYSLCVLSNGDIRMCGMPNDANGVLVRPAMWLRR